tara:strand:- start:364 stop:1953 length:1590 start_codon:yes stop_codon:yes gene_type:complete
LFFKSTFLSFRLKLLLSVFGVNLIVGSIIIFIAYNHIVNSQRDLIEQHISNLGTRLAEQFKPALDFDDKETVAEITDGILSNPDTQSVFIWKVDPFKHLVEEDNLFPQPDTSVSMELFFGKEKTPSLQINEVSQNKFLEDYISWEKTHLELGQIIYSGEVIFGYLRLTENLNRLNSFENDLKGLLFTSLLLYLALTILISFSVESELTKPLSELVNVAERVSLKNDLLVRARKISNDEFGKLTTVFNKMLDSIRDTNEALLDSNKEMENRVIERIKDLDDANQKLQTEIKNRIKNNKQLLKLQNKMSTQQTFASIGQVSSNIAHELRNPMAAIRNSVYFLQNNLNSSEKIKEHLTIIDEELTSSNKVVSRLLEMTKDERINLQTVNLEKLCNEVLAILGLKEKIYFCCSEGKKGSIVIIIDKLIFRQVIMNLFLNSYQAKKTNQNLEISVHVEEKNNFSEIEIMDNAKGIPEQIKNQVFKPLFSTKKDGFGLGLSFCSDVISKHDGTIEIKRSSKEGTTFFIRIPNAKH